MLLQIGWRRSYLTGRCHDRLLRRHEVTLSATNDQSALQQNATRIGTCARRPMGPNQI